MPPVKEEVKEEDTSKPLPSVIVGKVGRLSSQRTLGKDKKPEDNKPETSKPPLTTTAQHPQTMSASYYQQPTNLYQWPSNASSSGNSLCSLPSSSSSCAAVPGE